VYVLTLYSYLIVETFETMDESFGELAKLLQFRDKEQERVERTEKKKRGELSADDVEMDAWDKEMKVCLFFVTCAVRRVDVNLQFLTATTLDQQEYLFERKVKATDRTKTPEEIAKEEADRLHELETRRLARMNGDFDEDDLSDISDDEMAGRRGKRGKKDKKKKNKSDRGLNPEELSDSDDEENGDSREVRFTAAGLVYLNKDGEVVGKVGEEQGSADEDEEESDEDSQGSDEESSRDDLGDSEDEASAAAGSDESEDEVDDSAPARLKKGTKVQGNYHASEQYGGKENWYSGVITAVRKDSDGNKVYDVTYDDGDFEENMIEANVRPLPKTEEELENDKAKVSEAAMAKRKKQKAKMRAK
jgi:nucleolar protein 14